MISPLRGLPNDLVVEQKANAVLYDGNTLADLIFAAALHDVGREGAARASYRLVPLPGVPEEAKNQCEEGPCELSSAHRTITFSFRTGAPGRYRWQCFVPCAAGWLLGNGGPMQTVGYMDRKSQWITGTIWRRM